MVRGLLGGVRRLGDEQGVFLVLEVDKSEEFVCNQLACEDVVVEHVQEADQELEGVGEEDVDCGVVAEEATSQ